MALLALLVTTGCKDSNSKIDPIISADGPGVRFVTLGDQGTGSIAQYVVAEAIATKCATYRCDFALLLGDNIYPTGVTSATDPQFASKFKLPYANVDLPFYVSLGNHDYGSGVDFSKGPFQVEYGVGNPKWMMPSPGEYYAFAKTATQGSALFMALSTHLIIFDAPNSIANQGAYFDAQIAGSTEAWKVVYGHHPFISNGPHGNAGNYDGNPGSGALLRDFYLNHMCGKVDLFLGGHDHNMQLLPGPVDCPGTFVVAGAGGAALYPLSSINPKRFQVSRHGFAYVSLTDTTLQIEFYNKAGKLLYAHQLTK